MHIIFSIQNLEYKQKRHFVFNKNDIKKAYINLNVIFLLIIKLILCKILLKNTKELTMILDKLENAALYRNINERLSVAFDFLHSMDFNIIDNGKIEIAGKDIFAVVSEYHTKSSKESELEGHRKYIDVQYMIEGKELIGYSNLANQKISVDYNEENDIIFYKGKGDFFTLHTGSFAVFFPGDLHQPCIFIDKPALVRKVVLKVKI